MPTCRGQVGLLQRSARVGETNDLGQMRQAPRGVQPADELERGLVPVEPREEGDAGLLVVRRRGEDLAAQRLGGLQDT